MAQASKKDHREKIELVQACDEERWRTHTEESVEGGYTREKEERTTENKMERHVSTRFEKYWTESGRGDGQGDVEKKDHQLYRRPYMMGKARAKEEEDKSMLHPTEVGQSPTFNSFSAAISYLDFFPGRFAISSNKPSSSIWVVFRDSACRSKVTIQDIPEE